MCAATLRVIFPASGGLGGSGAAATMVSSRNLQPLVGSGLPAPVHGLRGGASSGRVVALPLRIGVHDAILAPDARLNASGYFGA